MGAQGEMKFASAHHDTNFVEISLKKKQSPKNKHGQGFTFAHGTRAFFLLI